MSIHLRGATNVTRSAIPLMQGQKWGRIINLTSYRETHDFSGDSRYRDENSSIVGFTKSVAKEVVGCGITVNVVSTVADAPMLTNLSVERKSELNRVIPVGYFENPDEVSCAVGFLASDEASCITGVVLPVDCGVSM
jgi:3-oxoacyl-[acyl-carrier protein] reductase